MIAAMYQGMRITSKRRQRLNRINDALSVLFCIGFTALICGIAISSGFPIKHDTLVKAMSK